jgi:hypothetical protein
MITECCAIIFVTTVSDIVLTLFFPYCSADGNNFVEQWLSSLQN